MIGFWIWVYLRWIPYEALTPLGLALYWGERLALAWAVVCLIRGWYAAPPWHNRRRLKARPSMEKL